MTSFTQILLVAIILCFGAMYWMSRELGVKSTKIRTLTVEVTGAKAEAQTLADATRRHAEQVAGNSATSRAASRAIGKLPNANCLDSALSADVLDTLGVYPSPSGKADPAPAGKRKGDPRIRRKDVPGRAPLVN